MAKVLICLVMTVVFSVLSLRSFMSNDYGPLRQWMAYYQEYRALQGALDKGNASKEELLLKLKTMYPEKAQELEAKFKAKYGNLQDDAQDARNSLSNHLDSSLSDIQEQWEESQSSTDTEEKRDEEKPTSSRNRQQERESAADTHNDRNTSSSRQTSQDHTSDNNK